MVECAGLEMRTNSILERMNARFFAFSVTAHRLHKLHKMRYHRYSLNEYLCLRMKSCRRSLFLKARCMSSSVKEALIGGLVSISKASTFAKLANRLMRAPQKRLHMTGISKDKLKFSQAILPLRSMRLMP